MEKMTMRDDKKILESAITECFGADIQIDQAPKLFVRLMVDCGEIIEKEMERVSIKDPSIVDISRNKKCLSAVTFLKKIQGFSDGKYKSDWLRVCMLSARALSTEKNVRPYSKGFQYIRIMCS